MSADNANNAIAIAVHTEQCCARLTTSMDRMLDGLQAQMEEVHVCFMGTCFTILV